MKGIYTLLILVFLTASTSFAQEGPIVPCVGCNSLTQAPFPETGLWHNPEQSPGSGLNFEVQNGVLAGFFYGYSNDGKPEWQLVSGTLVRSEVEGVLWELETTLTRAEGGSCIDCEFTPPDQITEGATIRLEFMQRNYMRVSIGDIFNQFFVPFTYGASAKAYFAAQTPYLFPELGALFVLIKKIKPGIETRDNYSSSIVSIHPGEFDVANGNLRYEIWAGSPIQDVPFGEIVCALDPETNMPGCLINFAGNYAMPVANFGDQYFYGEAEDEMTIEAFRLNYD